MALTVFDRDAAPPSRVVGAQSPFADVIKDVTFDSSYATGGLSLTPAMLGLTSILKLDASPAGGYVFPYDYTNAKLMALRSGSANGVLVEETATTNLATITTRIWARGAIA